MNLLFGGGDFFFANDRRKLVRQQPRTNDFAVAGQINAVHFTERVFELVKPFGVARIRDNCLGRQWLGGGHGGRRGCHHQIGVNRRGWRRCPFGGGGRGGDASFGGLGGLRGGDRIAVARNFFAQRRVDLFLTHRDAPCGRFLGHDLLINHLIQHLSTQCKRTLQLGLDLVDLLGKETLPKLLLQLLEIDQLTHQPATFEPHALPEVLGDNCVIADLGQGGVRYICKGVESAGDEYNHRQQNGRPRADVQPAVVLARTRLQPRFLAG